MNNNIKYNDLLNAAFNDERIIHADVEELKKFLLAVTEIREFDVLNDRVKEGIPKRKAFIEYLIQLKMKESEQKELASRTKWTLVISGVTLLVLVAKTIAELIA